MQESGKITTGEMQTKHKFFFLLIYIYSKENAAEEQ